MSDEENPRLEDIARINELPFVWTNIFYDWGIDMYNFEKENIELNEKPEIQTKVETKTAKDYFTEKQLQDLYELDSTLPDDKKITGFRATYTAAHRYVLHHDLDVIIDTDGGEFMIFFGEDIRSRIAKPHSMLPEIDIPKSITQECVIKYYL